MRRFPSVFLICSDILWFDAASGQFRKGKQRGHSTLSIDGESVPVQRLYTTDKEETDLPQNSGINDVE